MHPKNTKIEGVSDAASRIPLTRGYWTVVDNDDLPRLTPFSWHTAIRGTYPYAVAWIDYKNGVKEYLHRFLMNPPDGMRVDHIDGNTLNNQRSNLRIVSASQNSQNGRRHRDNRTGYRGIEYHSSSGLYMARITTNYKRELIGYFKTAEEAARAYDHRAREVHGIYARVNFPTPEERKA